MFSVFTGIVLIVIGVAAFWYLLPRDGKVHPFVENSNVGSMSTITILSVVIFGVALLWNGLIG